MSRKCCFTQLSTFLFASAVSVVLFSSCITREKSSSDYPVVWSTRLNLPSLKLIPKLIEQTNLNPVHYEDIKGNLADAHNCQDFFNLRSRGFYPVNGMEISSESFYIYQCGALHFLSQAKPASISFLRDFDLKKDYGQLPASIVFPSLEDSSDEKDVRSVNQLFPDTKIKSMTDTKFVQGKNNAQPRRIILESKKAEMETSIEVVAFGNFSGGGNDEMLIFVGNYVTEGTFKMYRTYLVTRHQEDGQIIIQKEYSGKS